MNVLVVDASAAVRSRLVALMAEAGLTVIAEAATATEARERAAAHAPDAIVLDVDLPDRGGLALVADFSLSTPVLVLTNMLSYRRRCLVLGALAFLDKSSEFGSVLEMLRAIRATAREARQTATGTRRADDATFPFGPCAGDPGVLRFPAMSETQRVLVVDDHTDASELLCLHLERLGHSCRDAKDGTTGLAIALEHQPTVAIVDLWLPDMTGHDVARTLRARDPNVYLIALTGSTRADDRTQAFESGFNEFLMKPADNRTLIDLIAKAKPR